MSIIQTLLILLNFLLQNNPQDSGFERSLLNVEGYFDKAGCRTRENEPYSSRPLEAVDGQMGSFLYLDFCRIFNEHRRFFQ